MKIFSWNINGIRAASEKGLLNFIEEHQPDIFCVQETKAHPDQVESALLHPLGMKSYWSSSQRKGYSGVATFVRREPEAVDYGIGIRKFDSEGRFVVSIHGNFKLYNVYFPNGGSGTERHLYKQEFLARFLRHLELDLKNGTPVIVLGDYNVAPLEIDVFDPVKLSYESGFLPEEREWFKKFLNAGFVDSFRHFFPERRNVYTWWSYVEGGRIQNKGWRIDHICVSKNLLPHLRRCEILDQVSGSDHCPIFIELE